MPSGSIKDMAPWSPSVSSSDSEAHTVLLSAAGVVSDSGAPLTPVRKKKAVSPIPWTRCYRLCCMIVALLVGASPLLIFLVVPALLMPLDEGDPAAASAAALVGGAARPPPCVPTALPGVNGTLVGAGGELLAAAWLVEEGPRGEYRRAGRAVLASARERAVRDGLQVFAFEPCELRPGVLGLLTARTAAEACRLGHAVTAHRCQSASSPQVRKVDRPASIAQDAKQWRRRLDSSSRGAGAGSSSRGAGSSSGGGGGSSSGGGSGGSGGHSISDDSRSISGSDGGGGGGGGDIGGGSSGGACGGAVPKPTAAPKQTSGFKASAAAAASAADQPLAACTAATAAMSNGSVDPGGEPRAVDPRAVDPRAELRIAGCRLGCGGVSRSRRSRTRDPRAGDARKARRGRRLRVERGMPAIDPSTDPNLPQATP